MPIHIFQLVRFWIIRGVSVVQVPAILGMHGDQRALVGLKVIGAEVGKGKVGVAIQGPVKTVDTPVDKFRNELRGKRDYEGLQGNYVIKAMHDHSMIDQLHW